MKKVFLLLLAMSLVTFNVNAQTDEAIEERVRFGIKASPNLSWTRSDTKGLEGDGTRLGYSVGLLAEFPIGVTGNYRFATGIYLTNIGGSTTYSTSIETPVLDSTGAVVGTSTTSAIYNQTMNLRFVELPLTIKMMTNEIGYIRYYGQLGVMAGANLRARADQENIITINGQVKPESDTDIDIQDQVRAIRAALVIGAGMEYNFSGQTALLAGVTYNSSIINLLEKDALAGFDNAKLLADYLELTLGVFF